MIKQNPDKDFVYLKGDFIMVSNFYSNIDDILRRASYDCVFTPTNISIKRVEKEQMPEIKDVIFNDPATIVFWSDGTKTIVKCQKDTGDVYSKETGLAMAIAKKAYGNRSNFNDILNRWLEARK